MRESVFRLLLVRAIVFFVIVLVLVLVIDSLNHMASVSDAAL